ncbi:MAG: oligosaccharide flippase family protein [Lachnospiraceae bacterium]|nr:oligosaccharide flippase family protein [Lachnospiraceae bacterium]
MAEAVQNRLTEGGVIRKLVLFAMPILIINLLQATYNMVNMVIVGQFNGGYSMSAVSIGGQITGLVLGIINGVANGAAIVTGQLFGQKREEDIRRLSQTLTTFAVLIALAISILVILLRRPILNILNTPTESYEATLLYVTICMCGTIFMVDCKMKLNT